MSRPRAAEAGERGFSLIEVLCALAIAAFALVALLRNAGISQLGAARAESNLGARIVLQSIVDDELAAETTSVDSREGQSGPYRWRLDIQTADDLPGPGTKSGYRLYRISGSITWAGGSVLTAETLKVAR